MKPLADLRWRLAPLVSFLNALGGWGFKWVRRFGVPTSILIFTFLYYNVKKPKYLYFYPLLALGLFFSFSLPLTLIGDSIPAHWQNWIWVAVFGWVQMFGLIPLTFFGKSKMWLWIAGASIHTAFVGILLTLSNTWGYPTHAWVEALIGLSFGGWAASLIDEN